ncbi:MAG TPA: hypothetical protein VH619_05430 [Verrucomicrobiae bacterium]|nr:hypothetical protein [Verrucomicrobiae bacterium]
MSIAACALMLLAGVMSWANQNAAVTARNSEYFTTTYAAEGATEKALGAMIQDDQDYGEGFVFGRTAYYAGLYPNSSDDPYWSNYQFSGGGTNNTVIVEKVGTNTTITSGPPFSGLMAQGATYEIIANAQNKSSMYGIVSTVGQQIVFAQIPIFQFAIFYQDDMEIDNGPVMTIAGLVHGNNNIWLDPGDTLTFKSDVSSTGNTYLEEDPLDPTDRTSPPPASYVNFSSNHVTGVSPLNIPVGTNTSGTITNVGLNVDGILQVPPSSESPTSASGTNRLYNKADMIIIISNDNSITVTSGAYVNNQATVISNSQWANFITTNGSFQNMRDGELVEPVDINVGQLRSWSATNTSLRPLLSAARGSTDADVSSIFVADLRMLSNEVIVTNIIYTTNTTTVTTTTFPGSGTYVPPVATNTLTTASSTYPSAGTFFPPVTTNTTATTSVGWNNPPTAGTYVPPVSTNTTSTTSSTKPTAGSYEGSYTQSGGKYKYNAINSYTYNLITGYIYAGITGYTYGRVSSINTNITYITNWTQFAEPGVVLTNGSTLPPNGLSVVTPDPAYISGNWNVSTDAVHMLSAQTTNTAYTYPSAIYADAVTILSPAWNPNNATATLTGSQRNATVDTVNAAILTGIVPSDGAFFSGGVENFVRFQENWSGVSFYYNGSMVEMFTSQIAYQSYQQEGAPANIYNAPNRYWAFDNNFSNPAKLPPLTPSALYMVRAQWTSLPPRTTQF